MMGPILTERQEELRSRLAGSLGELVRVLEGLGAESERARVVAGLDGLDRLFRLGVAGGPGTAVDGVVAALVPAPVARLSVVSVPAGEAAAWGDGVDVGLFVTSAARPLPPSEHPLLVAASDGAGALFVVVDGVEMLRLSEDLLRMEEAVAIAAEGVLGFRPHGAGISTALATGSPAPKESLVPALAGRVVAVLRAPAVVRPKLLVPLETALEVAEARRAAVADGLAALAEDLAKLDALEAELRRFDREAEAALREAEAAAGEAVAAFGERTGAFVRRQTRPFPLRLGRRRLERRFSEEAVGELPARLREAAARLDERVAGAAGPAESALDEVRPHAPAERLLGPLHRSRAFSLVLLGLGLLLVLGAAFGVVTLGTALPRPVLAAGLGAVSVLAAAALLQVSRMNLTAGLSGDLEDLRAAAAAALAAGAERAVGEGRASLRAQAAAYAPGVAAERDRLTAARDALERLSRDLAGLRGGVERL